MCVHQSGEYMWLILTRYAITKELVQDERGKHQRGEEADTTSVKKAVHDYISDAEGLSRVWYIANGVRIAWILGKLATYAMWFKWIEHTTLLPEMIVAFGSVWLSLIIAGGANFKFYDEMLSPFLMDRELDERSELGSFITRALRVKGSMGFKVLSTYLTQKEVVLMGTVTILIIQSIISLQHYLEG